MTANAIFDVTEAIRSQLEEAVGQQQVYVGPPADRTDPRTVSLFLFHIEPNRELRNTVQLTEPTPTSADTLLEPRPALPLDLRYLISVFRGTAGGLDPTELSSLGQVMQAIEARPTLGDDVLPGQRVRLTLEPYPMEETSRVWGLFPTTAYQTSVVYLASPVVISLVDRVGGPPVIERSMRGGVLEDVTT